MSQPFIGEEIIEMSSVKFFVSTLYAKWMALARIFCCWEKLWKRCSVLGDISKDQTDILYHKPYEVGKKRLDNFYIDFSFFAHR